MEQQFKVKSERFKVLNNSVFTFYFSPSAFTKLISTFKGWAF